MRQAVCTFDQYVLRITLFWAILLRFSKNGFLPISALAFEYTQLGNCAPTYTAIKPYTHMVILTPHPRAAMQTTLEHDPPGTTAPTVRDTTTQANLRERAAQLRDYYLWTCDRLDMAETKIWRSQEKNHRLRVTLAASTSGTFVTTTWLETHPVYAISGWPLVLFVSGVILGVCTMYLHAICNKTPEFERIKKLRKSNEDGGDQLTMVNTSSHLASEKLNSIQQRLSSVRRDVEGMLEE